MSEDRLARDIQRGKRAEVLLGDPLLTEAFDHLERAYIAAWRASNARDTDARERLWQAVHVVGKLRDHLRAVINDGTLAQAELDALL